MLPVSCGGDEELDMDSVVTALREFQQELRDAQRERVFLNSLIAEYDFKQTNKLSSFERVGLQPGGAAMNTVGRS